MTLYEMKEKMVMVGAELTKVENELMEKAANAMIPIDEVKALQEKKANLQTRFDLIKDQHDKLEAETKKQVEDERTTALNGILKDGIADATDDKARMIAAKAAWFRSVLLKKPVSDEVKAQLQALPAPTLSGGENFLPTTLENDLVTEPFVTNPLRGSIRVSNVKGLEVPKIAFELDDDTFIGDDDTAQEIEADGSKVSFGRFKFKVKVRVADTVLHGSDTNLVETIQSALRSGVAAKEKKVAFALAAAQESGCEHMSFYEMDDGSPSETVITSVEGADLFTAITNAIAALHEDFRANAKVVMAYADYVTMISDLSNGSMNLYNAQPEQIIGKPVIFADSASIPIVGDLSYCRLNYDGNMVYDSDKDVDAGEYIWVVTAWYDQNRTLNSAFRLAIVET